MTFRIRRPGIDVSVDGTRYRASMSGRMTSARWRAIQVAASALVIRQARDKGQVLYFIGKHNRVKIGITCNLPARLRSLQTGNAEKIDLLASIPGTRQIEQAVHERFAADRLEGEWFVSSRDLSQFIEKVRTADEVVIDNESGEPRAQSCIRVRRLDADTLARFKAAVGTRTGRTFSAQRATSGILR